MTMRRYVLVRAAWQVECCSCSSRAAGVSFAVDVACAAIDPRFRRF
jgi:hypothetical protein